MIRTRIAIEYYRIDCEEDALDNSEMTSSPMLNVMLPKDNRNIVPR